MKKIFTILLALLPVVAFCQEVPQKAEKIVITDTTMNFETHFRSVVKLLLKEGYKLENSDINTEIITTGYKTVSSGFLKADKADIKLMFEYTQKANGFTVTITGSLVYGGSAERAICNRGMGGSVAKETFVEMNRIASLINQTSKTYQVKDE